jgi:hypothetical protein
MSQSNSIQWEENGQTCSATWHSENGISAHKRVVIADDTLTADDAYRLACEGTALLWRGDFQHRLLQSQRARILGMLLMECNADHSISLRRAPDVSVACLEAYGPTTESYVISLRELLGVISAHEWRKNGVPVLADEEGEPIFIYPHYGVFSPIRGEYLELVCSAPLPKLLDKESIAFDIGVGTGVLSAILAMRGVQKIIATDQDDRALACAKENIKRLSLDSSVQIIKTNLFPQEKASLIVCNPPWIPARPSSTLEHAVYDPESQMLKGFLGSLMDKGG